MYSNEHATTVKDGAPGPTQTSNSTTNPLIRQNTFNPVLNTVPNVEAKSKKPQEKATLRQKVHQFVFSVPVQGLVFLLILLDLALLIVDIHSSKKVQGRIAVTTLIVICVMTLELLLRLFALSFKAFFRDPWNVLDLVVVLTSLVLSIIDYYSDAELTGVSRSVLSGRLIRILRTVGRAARIVRIVAKVKNGGKNVKIALRKLVGMNKKRTVDHLEGFDLDITTVGCGNRLYAMSVPAVGRMMIYRNPLPEVARFFNTKHPDAYQIYNCCPELPYPTELFKDQVFPYDIQDHTPPPMHLLVKFCLAVDAWLQDPSHVAAVHCRGGKGRTGSMCIAYLLYSGECPDATVAAKQFATRRTELTMKGKLQGVETPSQYRYLQQFDALLTQQHARGRYGSTGAAPSGKGSGPEGKEIELQFVGHELRARPLAEPSARPIKIRAVKLLGMFEAFTGTRKGVAERSVFVRIKQFRTVVQVSPAVRVEAGHALVTIDLGQAPAVAGDIVVEVLDAAYKDKLEAGNLKKPHKIPGMLMAVCFHTHFVDVANGLCLDLREIDIACKNKQKLYREDGQMQIFMQSA